MHEADRGINIFLGLDEGVRVGVDAGEARADSEASKIYRSTRGTSRSARRAVLVQTHDGAGVAPREVGGHEELLEVLADVLDEPPAVRRLVEEDRGGLQDECRAASGINGVDETQAPAAPSSAVKRLVAVEAEAPPVPPRAAAAPVRRDT